MTKTIAAAIAALLVTTTIAQAQMRPQTGRAAPGLRCADLTARVARSGRAIVPTGPQTFEEIVGEGVACSGSETRLPAFAVTGDNPQCPVGYSCQRVNAGSSR